MDRWTNGSFDVAWLDGDKIIIRDRRTEALGRGHGVCIMDGGDFEYILLGLIAAYEAGSNKGAMK